MEAGGTIIGKCRTVVKSSGPGRLDQNQGGEKDTKMGTFSTSIPAGHARKMCFLRVLKFFTFYKRKFFYAHVLSIKNESTAY